MRDHQDTRGPKEVAYDEEIFPLMEQIIAICDRAQISVVADFELDGDMVVATAKAGGKPAYSSRHQRVVEIIMPRPASVFGLTIFSPGDGR